jgi:superfamily II DNA or RNA helicase
MKWTEPHGTNAVSRDVKTGLIPIGPDASAVRLTPQGQLRLIDDLAGSVLEPAVARRLISAVATGSGHGLLSLALDATTTPLPADLAYWRDFAGRFLTALCSRPAPDSAEPDLPALAPPLGRTLQDLAAAAPPMTGIEYLTAEVLARLWSAMDNALAQEIAGTGDTLQAIIARRSPAWNLVGRVHFNLAENRKDEDAPFAFMATYTTRLSASAKAQHVPLGRALQEYSGARDKQRLLSLLIPVQKAAEQCPWLKAMVDAGEIYHPMRWTPTDAQVFLRDTPLLERAGVVVRMPASWAMGRPSRPQVKATVGTRSPSTLGLDAMLDFDFGVSLDGETLTAAEVKRLLAETDGLALVRGKWVEIDRDRLQRTLDRFTAVERRAREDGLSFVDAMRLVAGAGIGAEAGAAMQTADWSETVAGPWLEQTLAALRRPDQRRIGNPGPALQATLRPYQQDGVAWLHLLSQLRFGACLADDMGLGKTIQVIALLLVLKQDHEVARTENKGERNTPSDKAVKPSILVVPASLIGNWAAELEKFAPSLTPLIVHPSTMPTAAMKALSPKQLTAADLVITTYGTLLRVGELQKPHWRLVILDEAQAIKNAGTKQTRAVKLLKADARIAMTGTPIENNLGDLWSLFDFLNPGLLGSAKDFTTYTKRLADSQKMTAETSGTQKPAFGALRDLVRPYILRRMKTDKSIIADLPDKTEVKTFCALSKLQATLYQQTVDGLAELLKEADGIQRRGLVLATLMRLKQICNHPSQWLGDGAWAEADSGKLSRLREIASEIAARQEKVLVFSQFKEMAEPLSTFLGGIFGQEGVVLTGETPVGRRKDLVKRFQDDEQTPFFVLSVKAGGAGLNLTAASHVVHFDRWWNPAVENQATDRAFRIGQKRNVLVHKFVCRGTVEDRIDQMLEEKAKLSGDFLGGGAEMLLTEMKDDDLLKLVTLDLASALKDE